MARQHVDGIAGGAIACCLAAGMIALTGAILLLAPTSWPNDRVAGGLALAGSALLLPPVLSQLRRRVSSMRPAWVPVAIAVCILPAAFIIANPFRPTGEAKARLRAFTVVTARQEIASGDFSRARHLLERFSDDHDPAVNRLLAEIHASQAKPALPEPTPSSSPTIAATAGPANPSSIYAERIESYWIPQARALPDIAPDDDPTFGKLLTQIEELVIDAADGSDLPLTPAQRAGRSKFMAILSEKQAKLLPAMRRKYAKTLDVKLFRDDVRVSAQGTTMTMTGGVFVRNANIEDMETELGPVVNRLRFRRIAYRWSRYLNDGLHYDLDAPADRKLARWDGSRFTEIKR